jgi:hypothetical protein
MLNKISTLISPARFAPSRIAAVGMPSVLESVDHAVAVASAAVVRAEAEVKQFSEKTADERKAESAQNAESVFMAFHGFYGSMFASKFAIGQLEGGMDLGVLNAKRTWAWGLRAFSNQTVKRALDSILSDPASKFKGQIPHLGEFCALCREFAPVATCKPDTLALTTRPDPKARADRAEKNRAMVARYRYKPEAEVEAAPAPGLDALKQVVAQAVGLAGGDEAAELRRLDLMLAPRGAAA